MTSRRDAGRTAAAKAIGREARALAVVDHGARKGGRANAPLVGRADDGRQVARR